MAAPTSALSNVSDFVNSEYLFDLARDKTAEARSTLVEVVTDLPLSANDGISERERKLVFEILGKLVHETEMSVRRTISERMSDMPDAPRDMIRLLANDKIEIAYPVLTKSTVLKDEDLVEIVRGRTLEHQLAVAIRQKVSESVSDALVGAGDKNVIKCLLQNTNAEISRATMEYLVDQSEREDSFREPIVRRQDLDEDLAKKMFLWVSDVLRDVIVRDWDLPVDTVNGLLRDAEAREKKLREKAHPSKAKGLAEKLADQGLLTPQSMLRVLRNGDVALFIAMMQHMSKMPEPFVRKLVFDREGYGLAVLCADCGISREVFGAIYTLTRQSRPNDSALKWRYRQILSYYDNVDRDAAEKLVAGWRAHPDPTGLWDLGLDKLTPSRFLA